MKTRRLQEIDLAKLVAIDDQDLLEHALDLYETGGGIWSYDPVRRSTADIVGASTPLFGHAARVSWEKLERQIGAACKLDVQATANLLVGQVLYDHVTDESWSAAKFAMGQLSIGSGESVRYWSDLVLADEGGAFIAFFDHRRQHGLNTRKVMRIVFSMQHIGVRDRHPDLASTRLAIVRFPSDGMKRKVSVEFHRDEDLLSYEELNTRVENVYATWARAAERRAKKHAASGGEFFFGTK